MVKSLLESESVGVDDVSPDGYTALVIAAKEGHGELVECLIVHGAAVDGNDPVSLRVFSLETEHVEVCVMYCKETLSHACTCTLKFWGSDLHNDTDKIV